MFHHTASIVVLLRHEVEMWVCDRCVKPDSIAKGAGCVCTGTSVSCLLSFSTQYWEVDVIGPMLEARKTKWLVQCRSELPVVPQFQSHLKAWVSYFDCSRDGNSHWPHDHVKGQKKRQLIMISYSPIAVPYFFLFFKHRMTGKYLVWITELNWKPARWKISSQEEKVN
jgi:hypothetical protein